MSANFRSMFLSAAAAFGLIVSLGVGAAQAADAIESAPVPPSPNGLPGVSNWGGGYAGVTIGGGFKGHSHDGSNRVKTDGVVTGGFAGYNADLGNGVVAGVEADIGYSGVEGERRGVRVKSGVDGSVRARLGYAVTPDALAYVTAGGAAKRMKVSDAAGSDSASQVGWTAGVGADVKLTEKVFGRAEYRYTDYGSANFNTGSGSRSIDAHDHRVQVGFGVKF